ncbi:hypothetical protein KEJ14_00020 [Candidatus Bathyarchaeota archaeon]|nr:hypothetical protein [Candidatus Bathyarchaeota archaeon]
MQELDSLSKVGTISGIIVFFLGIFLLILTFYTGLTFILDPNKLVAFTALLPSSKTQGDWLLSTLIYGAAYLIPILLLFVLGYIASKVVAYGIQMYRTRPKPSAQPEKTPASVSQERPEQ